MENILAEYSHLVPYVVLALIFGGAAAAFYFGYLGDKKRTEKMKMLALQLGFSFTEKDPSLLQTPIGTFRLFDSSRRNPFNLRPGKKITNVLRRSAGGADTTVFDYRYTVRSGKHAHTYKQTVLAFNLSGKNLPPFDLRPENIFDKLGKVLGYKDINFEEYPEFSKSYLLKGKDETEIRKIFSQAVIQELEREKGWNIECRENWIIFYKHSRRISPEYFSSTLDKVTNIFNSLRK